MELVWAAGLQERLRHDLLSRAPHEHGGAVLARFARDGAEPRVSRSTTRCRCRTK